MNSPQAINLLKGLEQSLDDYCELNDEGKEAFRMAITALELFGNAEQLPSAQPELTQNLHNACTDIISRQEVIKLLDEAWVDGHEYQGWLHDEVNRLPSAQPEPHYDEWCTDCKEYDKNKHCCPRWNRVIRQTLKDMKEEQPEPQWIPVTERLPKSNGVYIVTRTINDGFTFADIVDACYFDGSDTWHDDTRVNHKRKYLNDIKAWMPLPEPYRKEGDEG